MASPADWIEVTDWQGRDGVHATRPDPYVIWAQLTGWADYPSAVWTPPPLPWRCRLLRWLLGLVGLVDRLPPCSPSTAALRRAVIIELDSAESLAAFMLQAAQTGDDIQIAPLYGMALEHTPPPASARFLTAFVTADGLRLLAQPALGKYVARFDLCEHIEPGRPNVSASRPGLRGADTPPPVEGTQLLGIIDDGCPFAHRSFLTSSGVSLSSRFAVLWDQNQIAAAFSSSAGAQTAYGSSPWAFDNGWEIRRGHDISASGLDDWIERFRDSATGSLDEDACYDLAGYRTMKRRIVHGPHVADIAAGPLRWRQTIYTDRDTPPGQDPVAFGRKDHAADPAVTDIAWVQLPRGGLQDSSGGWLDSHVLDGLRYLLWCRGEHTIKTVVSLSYGSTVGPHDGSSILAQAIDAIVDEECAARPDAKLHVVIAGGNSFDAKGHALVELQAGDSRALVWRVLPGSEAPSFLQVWLPDETWALSLARPDGLATSARINVGTVHVAPDAETPDAAVMYLKRSSRGNGPMVLIALAPTAGEGQGGRAPAPHGDWAVRLHAGSNGGVARAYIARNDLDMDAVLRGRQSVFVDPPDSPAPELRQPFDDPGKNEDDDRLFGDLRRDTVLRRRGTLNAIGSGTGVDVVAGHRRNYSDAPEDRTHPLYSSAGPGPGDVGRNPLTSYPTDESGVVRGVRAAGSRSGSVFRLVGTSTAAPQLARWLLSEPDPNSRSPPPPTLPPPPSADEEALYGKDGGRPASQPL